MTGLVHAARVALVGLLLAAGHVAAQPATPPAGAEETKPAPTESTLPPVDPKLARLLATPRSAVEGFLDALEEGQVDEAVRCLDLSELDKATAQTKGRAYAIKLKAIVDRMGRLQYDEIVLAEPESDFYNLGDDLAAAGNLVDRDLDDAERIRLTRDAQGLWRFSPETVASIDEVWPRWDARRPVTGLEGSGENEPQTFEIWLARLFPPAWRETRFLFPNYQWVCLVGLIFLGLLADQLVRMTLGRITRAWFRYARPGEEVELKRGLWRPVGLLANALVWYAGTKLLGLPATALMVLLAGLKLFAVVAGVWTAFTLTDLMATYLARQAAGTRSKFDDLLIPLVSKTLKALAVCVGVLLCAEAFNLPMTGLLGGLGIGGMALALASKDAVANLFGSFTVLVDRPFEVGDWIVTEGIEGSVETVGFRSTRVRTFYNSQITVPNSLLTTAVVDNMGRRRYRRIKTMIGVEYGTTPEQVEAFCEGIRELIRRHPYTRKDYFHVYFNQFSASSLDILLYCFVECPDWAIELQERHRLLLDIVRLARDLEISFAFPTQTLHMFSETPVSPPALPGDPPAAGRERAARIASPPGDRTGP